MKAKIELLKNRNGCWQWRITASNGEVLCHSEAYASKQKCNQTAKRLAACTGLEIAKAKT